MGRLIDAEELMTVTDIREDGTEVTYVPYSEIEDAPTAYDPDEVVDRLEELKRRYDIEDFGIKGIICKAIEIVKGGGVDGN